MRHSFSRLNFFAAHESGPVSEWQHRKQVSVVVYCRLIISLFAVAVWGLHEEDVRNKLLGLLRPNVQLLQCPVCERQRVVPLGETRTCSGRRGRRSHDPVEMVSLGRRDKR